MHGGISGEVFPDSFQTLCVPVAASVIPTAWSHCRCHTKTQRKYRSLVRRFRACWRFTEIGPTCLNPLHLSCTLKCTTDVTDGHRLGMSSIGARCSRWSDRARQQLGALISRSFLTFDHGTLVPSCKHSKDFERFFKQFWCLVWSDLSSRVKQKGLSVRLETESSCSLRYQESSDCRC